MKYKSILTAPTEYWPLDPSEKAYICNGAGPKGYEYMVPDTMYGLSITEAADIHDYMYYIGGDEYDRRIADDVFLINMQAIVELKTKWKWLKKLLLRRVRIYYLAVTRLGHSSFNYRDI
jgi:hypothetical protein